MTCDGFQKIAQHLIAFILLIEKWAALKLLLVKKFEDHMIVNLSQFLLEQTARHRYFTPTPKNVTPDIPPLPSSPNHLLLNDFIISPYYHSTLLQQSVVLTDTLNPIFYTDGSIDTYNQKAGAAWIETSHDINSSFHANIQFSWMISFKAELLAIILALIVARQNSIVTIYTDSKSVIDKFTSLSNDHDRFSSARHNSKIQYFKYWSTLFHIIDRLQLKVILKKVKAHRGNKFNEEADKLAKAALNLSECLSFNTNHFAHASFLYKQLEIEDHLRNFIKTVSNVSCFSQFLNLKRNSKYRKTDVDWNSTCSIIKGTELSNVTNFRSSHLRSKRMKWLLEELPTVEFYKATKPNLYDDNWSCLFLPIQ
jgi:ribonuclease HI